MEFKEFANAVAEYELTNEVYESSAHHSCTNVDDWKDLND